MIRWEQVTPDAVYGSVDDADRWKIALGRRPDKLWRLWIFSDKHGIVETEVYYEDLEDAKTEVEQAYA